MCRRLLLALVLVFAALARADDSDRRAKAECKQGCLTDFQDCKSECQPEANTGWGSEGQRYADCDADCHRDYGACKAACEPD